MNKFLPLSSAITGSARLLLCCIGLWLYAGAPLTAQPALPVLPDSLLIGSPLVLDLANVQANAGDTLGLWEVWEVTEKSLTISTFSEGFVPFPAIPVRTGGRSDTLRFSQGIWISLPKVPDGAPAPIRDVLPLAEPVLPWLAPILGLLGLFLGAVSWLVAASQKLGPMPKTPPPLPPAIHASRALLSLREQISHPDTFERARRILKRYLTEQFLLPAQGLPDAELPRLPLPNGVDSSLVLPLFRLLETASSRRYAGETASLKDTQALLDGLEKLVNTTATLRQREGQHYLMEEGLSATWWRRWLASQTDFLPPWLVSLSLCFWLFPSWTDWQIREVAFLVAVAWGIGQIARFLLSVIMTRGRWQATPGMRAWRLALAVEDQTPSAQRALAALMASLPWGLGHFFNGRQNESMPAGNRPGTQVRWYPLSHRENKSK